ncbi:class I SAM-dependent methyltransferase [Streptomyces sp. NPDC051109]|uniref:class I SAM-dependent methyltransferase n=1 Tax=Streptomyces sp. NPDC051109 TaxID=3365642 RepID=UPI0037A0F60F
MAEVLRRTTVHCPEARLRVGAFEDWQPDSRGFGLVLAATSWHWTDPERRWDLVHDALAPGGAVALFWNPQGVHDTDLHAALADVDGRHGMDGAPHGELASSFGEVPGNRGGLPSGWSEDECRRDGRFTDFRAVRYRQDQYYDPDHYLGCPASLSRYRVLPSGRREQVLAETAQVLRAHGGGISRPCSGPLPRLRTSSSPGGGEAAPVRGGRASAGRHRAPHRRRRHRAAARRCPYRRRPPSNPRKGSRHRTGVPDG